MRTWNAETDVDGVHVRAEVFYSPNTLRVRMISPGVAMLRRLLCKWVVIPETEPWLERCAIGQLKELYSLWRKSEDRRLSKDVETWKAIYQSDCRRHSDCQREIAEDRKRIIGDSKERMKNGELPLEEYKQILKRARNCTEEGRHKLWQIEEDMSWSKVYAEGRSPEKFRG